VKHLKTAGSCFWHGAVSTDGFKIVTNAAKMQEYLQFRDKSFLFSGFDFDAQLFRTP
jgi:hypothetical protein